MYHRDACPELVALYVRKDAEKKASQSGAGFPDVLLMDELEQAITVLRDPEKLGDVMEWESWWMQLEGVLYLIRTQAADHYDDIIGYFDRDLIDQAFDLKLLSAENANLDGVGICEWIDAHIPPEESL